MESIELRSYAKINLSLEVTGRRADGYHDIRSLMQGVDLWDVIRITKCARNGTKYNLPHCTIGGIVVYLCTDAETIPADMTNLAFRGIAAVTGACEAGGIFYDRLTDHSDLYIELDKKLPVAAGIAGGSGNAAVCMLGFNALMGNIFSLRQLMEIGVRVGADVPFSLMMNACRNSAALAGMDGETGLRGLEEARAAAWVSGIGDIVEPVEPCRMHVIMANPGISVSTRDAYEAIDRIRADGPADRDPYTNDLEMYTLDACPEAAALKAFMQEQLGACRVLMSGSGPTIIAYYTDGASASRGYEIMNEAACAGRGWRVWLTETGVQ